MTIPLVLTALAVLFLIVEFHAGSLHSASIAVGMLVAAALSYFAPATSHLLLGIVIAAASVGVYFLLRSFIRPLKPVVMAESVGQIASIASVAPDQSFRVSYSGSEWDGVHAEGHDSRFKPGDFVKVMGVSGIKLVVKATS